MSGFFQRLVRPCPNPADGGNGKVCSFCTEPNQDCTECSACPDCAGGWVDLDATEHPLAAWAIPGDTVLSGRWLLTLMAVRESWVSCDDSDLADEGFYYEGPSDGLARVVTPADEARRAEFSPQFAYPTGNAMTADTPTPEWPKTRTEMLAAIQAKDDAKDAEIVRLRAENEKLQAAIKQALWHMIMTKIVWVEDDGGPWT